MLCVVCGQSGFHPTVSRPVNMKGEKPRYFRFFAYWVLFIFMMTKKPAWAENSSCSTWGWGRCRGRARSADWLLLRGKKNRFRLACPRRRRKAFLVNRVGRFGFGLGIHGFGRFWRSVRSSYSGMESWHAILECWRFAQASKAAMSAFSSRAMKWIPFLRWWLRSGKSANNSRLSVWLPGAMEGHDHPSAALIHAATGWFTAGVYMIARWRDGSSQPSPR